MQNYKNLIVWDESHKLVIQLYKTTGSFPKNEQFGLTSQLRRAAVSVPANIAEGCGRYTDKDTLHFFQIALGSLHESEYYILLAKELDYINDAEYKKLTTTCNNAKAMLLSLIKKIRN
jgi:four helix bundle protein